MVGVYGGSYYNIYGTYGGYSNGYGGYGNGYGSYANGYSYGYTSSGAYGGYVASVS